MTEYLPHIPHRTGRDNSVTAREVVYILFRRRLVILAIWIPILVVASMGLFKNTGSYVAECQVLLELQAPEIPRWNTKSYVDYDRSLSTHMHMAMSVPVSKLATEILADSLDVIATLDEGVFAELRNPNKLTNFLTNHLAVSPVGESSILKFSIGTLNTRFSLMAVGACRDAFLRYSVDALKKTQALEYYDEQVNLVQKDIDRLLKNKADIVAEAGYISIETDIRFDATQLANLRDRQFEQIYSMKALRAMADSYRKARLENPDYFPSTVTGRNSNILVGAKEELEKRRSRLQGLRAKYTDDHVEVRRAEELLAAAKKTLDGEIEAFIKSLEIDADAAETQANVLQNQIDELRAVLNQIPDIDRRVTLIEAEVHAKNSLLEDLQLKRGEVQITQQADDRINMFIKLTEPEIQMVISGSRKFAYFAVISLMGLAMALAIAFILNFQDHRFHSPDEMEEHLGVPVLGAISQDKRIRDVAS